MGTLEQTLQELHEAGKRIEISWLWDGGVEVNAGGEEKNFGLVSEVLPWLQHWFGLKDRGARPDALATELQKIYDSEINITLRTGGKKVFIGLGNDFTGFEAEATVIKVSEVLPWLQKAVHEHAAMSKYDVERLGGNSHRKWRSTENMSEGEIVNSGDLRGRVLQASEIELAWDGNLVSALIGEDLVVGVSGFGNTIPDALRELADNLIREAVWVEIPEQESMDPSRVRELENTSISTDVMELYRLDEERMCVFVGSKGSHAGVFVVGPSVHEALRTLADKLVSAGVWIDVTAARAWVFQEIPEEDSFLQAKSPDLERIEKEDDLD